MDMVKQVKAAHILVKTEKKARDIKTMMETGESFSAMARKYSDCPSGRDGGDLGWFGRGQMVPDFEKAAFAGVPGDVLGPVRTNFGWHLIMVQDTK